MAFDRYDLIKVKGAKPEAFWIVWVDSALPKDSFIQTSQNLSEADVRKELSGRGLTETDISSLIARARAKSR